MDITQKNIESAHKRIAKYIHKTPVLTSSFFNKLIGAEVYFKCENFQKVGAFKIRGAMNALLRLSKEQRSKGVVAHSSGNHAQALALAAKTLGLEAHIVMPLNAPKVKVKAVMEYGAEVYLCLPTLQARKVSVHDLVKQLGLVEVHPYDDDTVITGQATAAKELIEEIPKLEYLIAPVGGGGLLSGTALSAQYFGHRITTLGAEPKGADDARMSLSVGRLITPIEPNTIADGLLTSLCERTFRILRLLVPEIVAVTEEEIIEAMQMVWQRMKIIIEPSAAVAVAMVIKEKERFKGKRVGVILSGGNVELTKLPFSEPYSDL